MAKGSKPPGWRGDEDRALEAMARRNRERAQAQTRADDEDTDPQRPSLLARAGGEVAIEQHDEHTGLTERIAADPDLYALFQKIERVKDREIEHYRKMANEALAAHGEGALAPRVVKLEDDGEADRTRITKIESNLAIGKWLLGILLAATISMAVTIISAVYSRGVASGEIEIRLQHLERDLARVLQTRDPSGQPRPFVPTIKP